MLLLAARWTRPVRIVRSFTLRLVLTALLATTACSDSQKGPTHYDYPVSRAATIPIDGQVLFPVQVDDRAGFFPMVVDTGAFSTTVTSAS